MVYDHRRNFAFGIIYDVLLLILAIGIGLQITDFTGSTLLMYGTINIILVVLGFIFIAMVYFGKNIDGLLGFFFVVMLVDIVTISLQENLTAWILILLGIVAIAGAVIAFSRSK